MVRRRPRAACAGRARRRSHRRLWRRARQRRAVARRGVCPPRRARARDREAARDRARARRGPRRCTPDPNSVLEADSGARRLLESLGYGAVRVFRELRVELQAPPPTRESPDGLRVVAFDPERDVLKFHAAGQEAFADHWGHVPRDVESWSQSHLGSERFDPTLWCVVRAGDEIAAGTICTSETYGGGWVHELFTRRPWRKQGVGAALLVRRVRALLGARRAQRRAQRRRGERHRRVPPLPARRDGARARLGDRREGARRSCVSGDQRFRIQTTQQLPICSPASAPGNLPQHRPGRVDSSVTAKRASLR